jgi:hypothetical protein
MQLPQQPGPGRSRLLPLRSVSPRPQAQACYHSSDRGQRVTSSDEVRYPLVIRGRRGFLCLQRTQTIGKAPLPTTSPAPHRGTRPSGGRRLPRRRARTSCPAIRAAIRSSMAGAPSLGVAGPKAARSSGARPSRPTRLSALACGRRDTRPAGMPEGIRGTRGHSERGEQEPDDHSRARGRALARRRAWPNRERGCSRSLAHRGGMPACRCVAHRMLSTPPGGHYLPGRRAVCRLDRHRLVARPAAQGRSRHRSGDCGESGEPLRAERTECSPDSAATS